jgi:Cu/Zn superoxide dismutase
MNKELDAKSKRIEITSQGVIFTLGSGLLIDNPVGLYIHGIPRCKPQLGDKAKNPFPLAQLY